MVANYVLITAGFSILKTYDWVFFDREFGAPYGPHRGVYIYLVFAFWVLIFVFVCFSNTSEIINDMVFWNCEMGFCMARVHLNHVDRPEGSDISERRWPKSDRPIQCAKFRILIWLVWWFGWYFHIILTLYSVPSVQNMSFLYWIDSLVLVCILYSRGFTPPADASAASAASYIAYFDSY